MADKSNNPLSSSLERAQKAPRSLTIARQGIKTDRDFSALMSALMSDLIDGSVSPGVGNATVNAGGKLLKVVEMRLKYGTQQTGAEKLLQLTT